jgi:transposase
MNLATTAVGRQRAGWARDPVRTPAGGAAPLAARLVPDEMWDVARALLPPGRQRIQGGGRPRADERAGLVAVVFVLTSGGSWRSIPESLGVAVATAHRRFCEWTEHDLWRRLDAGVRRAGCSPDVVAWTSTLTSAALARAGESDTAT